MNRPEARWNPPRRPGSSMRAEPVYRVVVAVIIGLFRLLRLRITITGADNIPARGGAVIAITHYGYLDFALAELPVWKHRRRLTRFMATSATWRNPVARPLMDAMHHIPVQRGAGADAYAQAVQALRAGELVGVLPEAMVSRSWTVKALKTGAVRMATEADVPIVPVVVWGGHRVLTRGRRPRLRDAWRTPVSICVGMPLIPDAADAVDPAAGTERLRDVLVAMTDRAQAEYPDDAPDGIWWQPEHLGGGAPTPFEVAELETRERQAS